MICITILIGILVFGVLIFVHELGHFITAKLSKMNVEEFAIGMGPAIFKWHRKETQYAIRILPIGGFVKLEGEDGEAVTKDKDGNVVESQPLSENSFYKKPALARFAVLFAGSFMNLFTAFLVSVAMVLSATALLSSTIEGFHDSNTSSKSGLAVGDQLVKMDGKKIHVSTDVSLILSQNFGKPMDIVVRRDGKLVTLKDVQFPTVEEQGMKLSTPDFYLAQTQKNFFTIIHHSYYQCIAITRSIWQSLGDLFTGKVGVSQLSGPVGTTKVIGQAAKAGPSSLMFFFIFISINVGIMNLLPFPALDGGRIFLLIIEKIRRKPLPANFEGALNFVGFALLMLLMVYVTFNDITRMF
ncbi:MAG: RIP metalloprotease RseP [Bacillota bacterium]|nr:RIP metalloprotease RseP [Bacillota bacterium]